MEHLLDVRNLCVEYKAARGHLQAVSEVNFSIDRGEFLGLAGESGCGKSTIAYAIMGLLKGAATISGGEILFNGKNVLSFNQEQMRLFRWEKTSMVLQSAMNNLNPVITIGSQLTDVILAHTDTSPKVALERAKELLHLVNINSARIDAFPHELSGGMRQRVVIAMALALSPDLIIFDEPTTALDVVVQYNIIRKITELKKQMGFSILFITHDLPLMLMLCDRIGIMYAGKLAELASADTLKNGGQHPYTQGLLQAFPSLIGPKKILKGIPGSVPDLITPPKGCLFYQRCSRRIDECAQNCPSLELITENHYCACNLALKETNHVG